MPAIPKSAEPNNQTAAGIGTGATCGAAPVSCTVAPAQAASFDPSSALEPERRFVIANWKYFTFGT
jgi:hypothetical protein